MSVGAPEIENLERSRAELRALIDKPPGEFPRSALLQSMLAPRKRWGWLLGAAVLAVAAARRLPLRAVGTGGLTAYALYKRAGTLLSASHEKVNRHGR